MSGKPSCRAGPPRVALALEFVQLALGAPVIAAIAAFSYGFAASERFGDVAADSARQRRIAALPGSDVDSGLRSSPDTSVGAEAARLALGVSTTLSPRHTSARLPERRATCAEREFLRRVRSRSRGRSPIRRTAAGDAGLARRGDASRGSYAAGAAGLGRALASTTRLGDPRAVRAQAVSAPRRRAARRSARRANARLRCRDWTAGS